jgi:hypothetical protein
MALLHYYMDLYRASLRTISPSNFLFFECAFSTATNISFPRFTPFFLAAALPLLEGWAFFVVLMSFRQPSIQSKSNTSCCYSPIRDSALWPSDAKEMAGLAASYGCHRFATLDKSGDKLLHILLITYLLCWETAIDDPWLSWWDWIISFSSKACIWQSWAT